MIYAIHFEVGYIWITFHFHLQNPYSQKEKICEFGSEDRPLRFAKTRRKVLLLIALNKIIVYMLWCLCHLPNDVKQLNPYKYTYNNI